LPPQGNQATVKDFALIDADGLQCYLLNADEVMTFRVTPI
jgi:hypothetical protein